MKLYGISGLGADERVYERLSFNCEFQFVNWIIPHKNEPLKEYAKRLSLIIDTSEEFGLIGVSFGGLIAIEIAKVLNPKLVILISSIEMSSEMNYLYRSFGKSKISLLFPVQFFDLPRGFAKYLFGTKSPLLNEILDDTDLRFTKWAINQLLNWKNTEKVNNLYRIHGTKDRLLKCPVGGSKNFLIKNGGHLAIVDEAEKVNEIIELILSQIYFEMR